MPNRTLVINMGVFHTGFAVLNKYVLPRKANKGLAVAGRQFMLDTVGAVPTTPIHRPDYGPSTRLPGELRASGAVFVGKNKTGDSKGMGEGATGKYQPNAYGGTPIRPGQFQACVVLNAPYAAAQHERFPVKTELSAGMKFMETKLFSNGLEYMRIIVSEMKL